MKEKKLEKIIKVQDIPRQVDEGPAKSSSFLQDGQPKFKWLFREIFIFNDNNVSKRIFSNIKKYF